MSDDEEFYVSDEESATHAPPATTGESADASAPEPSVSDSWLSDEEQEGDTEAVEAAAATAASAGEEDTLAEDEMTDEGVQAVKMLHNAGCDCNDYEHITSLPAEEISGIVEIVHIM